MRTATQRLTTSLAALTLAPLLALTLAGCSEEAEDSSAQTDTTENTSSDAPTAPAPEESDEEDAPETITLDHAGALAAGLGGEHPIQCVYHFTDEELAGIAAFSPNGWTTPVADIYLARNAAHWEIPQEDGRTSHVLVVDDVTYDWKTPAAEDALGASAKTPGGLETTRARVAPNASDCTVYTGPMSIFEVPSTVTFKNATDI